MKRCPSCQRTYTDASLNFCLEDGSPLVNEAAPSDPSATVRYSPARDTSDPPPTEIYQPAALLNQVPEMSQPHRQWAPATVPPKKKSNAIWWLLGGVVVVGVIGIGLVIMIVAVMSLGTDSNANRDVAENENTSVVSRNDNANSNSANRSNSNSSTSLPASFSDDFSEQSWGTGNSKFGDIWYADGEYHMRSKEKTFLVMYAPDNNYNTEAATVRVTARSVDGIASTSGYGLLIHGQKSKSNQLEDYGILIYTGETPQYQIVSHRTGNQSSLVPWTKSSIIRSGTSPNLLEARIKGAEISFYINGQYINRITDTENYRRGVVGLYTSDTNEVAFDDLEIRR